MPGSTVGVAADETAYHKIAVACLAGLGALVLFVLLGGPSLLPARLAGEVSRNSEAYVFALVVVAWLLRLTHAPRSPRIGPSLTALLGLGLLGGLLLVLDLPSSVRTLNEPVIALALLLPYLALPRPMPRLALLAVPALLGVIAYGLVLAPESWIIDQAETWGFVILTIVTFDVVDRGLLTLQPPVHACRVLWWVFLAAEPLVVSLLGREMRQEEAAWSSVLHFLGRIHESFVGVLLVSVIASVIFASARRHPRAREIADR